MASTTQSKNKSIFLSLADFIAIGMFLISLGISIGYYKSTIDQMELLEKDVKQMSGEVKDLGKNNVEYDTSFKSVRTDIERLYNQVNKK